MALEIFTRLGRLIRVKNTNKKGYAGEREDFIAVWVKGPNGAKCLLFTDGEIARAETRSEKNPEDLTKRSWISEILD
jgi:hypothetical protein